MARRNKLMKFAEMQHFHNVFQVFDPTQPTIRGHKGNTDLRGKWADHFGNDNPLILELACGRGEYSLGLSNIYPDKNFVGVDVKGARIWKGASTAIQENINNVAFLRTRIEVIESCFAPNEVDEIWITFPDPFPSKENRRLSSENFLMRYKKILKKDHRIHLKTDSIELYEFSVKLLQSLSYVTIHENINDLYSLVEIPPVLQIKTYYEKMHLAAQKKITYLSFSMDL